MKGKGSLPGFLNLESEHTEMFSFALFKEQNVLLKPYCLSTS